jgi:hypothetical protein
MFLAGLLAVGWQLKSFTAVKFTPEVSGYAGYEEVQLAGAN